MIIVAVVALLFSCNNGKNAPAPENTSAAETTRYQIKTEPRTEKPTEEITEEQTEEITEKPTEPPTEKPTEPPTEAETDRAPIEYRNALSSAESYLSHSSFSKSDLYDQLIYEKFTPEQAQYGVDIAYQ